MAFTLVEIPPGGCRWPIAESEEGSYLFCDADQHGGKSYCCEHFALAYVPARKPRSRREKRAPLDKLSTIAHVQRVDLRGVVFRHDTR